MQKLIRLVFILLFLTACTPHIAAPQSPVSTVTFLPTATKISNPSTPTVDALIEIIYASDPNLPQYDPASTEYAEFPNALKQLSDMGAGAIDAASHLAVAITFPRSDSYLAAQTLLVLGPELTELAIPILIDNLRHQKPEARVYSAVLLGSVGNQASCAVGDIAPLLWDSDSLVRSAVALALERIIEQDLVSSEHEILVTPLFLTSSLLADIPEGQIVEAVRHWWNEQGSKIDWHPEYGICDP